ncbi:MAG: dTDP-4-dehydrorhamnose reductase [Planctomycetaceae bacterium]
MRIAVIGAHGQLGSDLIRRLGGNAVGLTHADIEITDPASILMALDAASPDVVINTAAYNLVDKAEQEPQSAFAINAFGPRHVARYCAQQDIVLVHVSTDYVFGQDAGRARPYTEGDLPGPVSVYGTSKLAGEHLVRASCPRHFIVRSCGLYGRPTSAGKGNFVRTMLRLANDRDELSVVDDQHCTPTSTADLAAAIVSLVRTEDYGVYHMTNSGSTTWCGFAREIFARSGLDIRVKPITSAQYSAPARRPAYSVLDCGRFTRVTGVTLSCWQHALAEYLSAESADH